jgi:DNA-binding MarR family transcriptional regulator
MQLQKLPCYCGSLRQAARALSSFYDERLVPSGIGVSQFTLMTALKAMGGARNRDLQDALAIDQTTLTRNLTLLRKRRFVDVIGRPSKREKVWGLTTQGEETLRCAQPLWEAAQKQVRRRMGGESAESFLRNAFELASALI